MPVTSNEGSCFQWNMLMQHCNCRAFLSAGPPHVAVPVPVIFNLGVGGSRKSSMRTPQQMQHYVAKRPSDDAVCQFATGS